MRNQQIDSCEQRRGMRVSARGSVIVHGNPCGRGRVVDVSAGGVRFRDRQSHRHPCGESHLEVEDVVELELRLDGHGRAWSQFVGRIERIERNGVIAIDFLDIPDGFEDVIQGELLAELERADH